MLNRSLFTGAVASIAMLISLGCGNAPPAAVDADRAAHSHTHDAWWCDEHGVPEEVCALCSAKVAADYQKRGDWCKEHDRPDSQCFACHPELEAKFGAQYKAKYGKTPPKPSDNSADKT